mmetsp:Transcript_13336/g.31012  ORF Transcript_13336/g.31012 Transcript_13336/m.31012 type:complete len:200 (-) Transcript_13336:189-788(-)
MYHRAVFVLLLGLSLLAGGNSQMMGSLRGSSSSSFAERQLTSTLECKKFEVVNTVIWVISLQVKTLEEVKCTEEQNMQLEKEVNAKLQQFQLNVPGTGETILEAQEKCENDSRRQLATLRAASFVYDLGAHCRFCSLERRRLVDSEETQRMLSEEYDELISRYEKKLPYELEPIFKSSECYEGQKLKMEVTIDEVEQDC